ncbi:hypothetical protein [Helicobacter suis]|uniref:hypothetical protein n=1 Tax=Helicobacter suis TaxID=104628 RepID=UPI002491CE6F|nr:hypothetical protein [Helicobacter suis]
MRLKMQKIGYSSSPIAYEHEGMRLEGGVKRISSNLFFARGAFARENTSGVCQKC